MTYIKEVQAYLTAIDLNKITHKRYARLISKSCDNKSNYTKMRKVDKKSKDMIL